MKSRLSTQFEVWKEQWLAEGFAIGLAKGLAKAKANNARVDALMWVLSERFGTVAPSRQKRIRRAKLATLDRWFKRAIVAPDLSSVFNRSR